MAKRLKGVPNLPFAPIAAALFGLVAAILVFATPVWMLERVVGTLGIGSFLPAARPPLGDTARTVFAAATGISVGLMLWLLLRPVEKLIHRRRTGAPIAPVKSDEDQVELLSKRWRGGREPIFAESELGAPLMSEEALAAGGELFRERPMKENVQDAAPWTPEVEPVAFETPDTTKVEAAFDAPPSYEFSQPESAPEKEQPVFEPAPASLDWASIEPVKSEPVADYEPVTFEALDSNDDASFDEAIKLEPPVGPEAPVAQAITSENFDFAGLNSEPESSYQPAPVAAPIVAPNEVSLHELLGRLETALEHRAERAAVGEPVSQPPAPGTVASLRSMISGLGHKSVA